jgi:hypothetical protein
VRKIELNGISISVTQLLLKGVPEGMLTILALHFFTETKVTFKKYLPLSLVYITIIYLIRFLPITIGVNTMLSILLLIFLFQITYRTSLSKIVRTVISAIFIMILIIVSEALNFFTLYLLLGQNETAEYMNSSIPIIRSVSTIPSTIFYALFVLIGYLILNKRNSPNGKACKKTGE